MTWHPLQTPFWANNHADMYMNVLHNELVFPVDDALDRDTKSFIRGVRRLSFELNSQKAEGNLFMFP